ncbi:hypothetical protein [Chthonobacter albigriseus]|uniref:hypothetical protein n=1 Tax=Chthonobacter albigriseus TaxID=1683161 RepID=UPI0015EF4121|nr:hypothetical protein [Chthonobacter albigriseus]
MLLKRRVTTSVAAIAILALSSATAFAATEAEISKALTELFVGPGGNTDVKLGTPTEDGGSLVYSNVEISQPPTSDGVVRDGKIETLTLTGADIDETGALIAESLVAEKVSGNSNDGSNLKVDQIEVTNLVAKRGTGDTLEKGRYDSIIATTITGIGQQNQAFSIDKISLENADYVGDYPRTVGVGVEGVLVDLTTAPPDPGADQLKALGYTQIRVNLFGDGTYEEGQGTISLERITIEGDEMGSLTLEGELYGFTPDVLAMLQQQQPPPDVLGKITLGTATLTYEDSSLANRIMEQYAKAQGVTREAFAEQMAAALPLFLTALQNPAFQAKVATAAGAFLKDPKNISITVAPENPISLMELVGTIQAAPQTLPDALKAEIQANQSE